VPHALVSSAIVQERGLVALGALLSACLDARRPEPWLTNALADAFLASVRESARLLASAGFDVDPRPLGLLDLPTLFQRAEDADAALLAAFARDVNAGRLGSPEDDDRAAAQGLAADQAPTWGRGRSTPAPPRA